MIKSENRFFRTRAASTGGRAKNQIPIIKVLTLLLLLNLPVVMQAQWNYTVNADSTITITGYTGPSGVAAIPSAIYGVSVTRIANDAFFGRTNLTTITIPSSVTNIGSRAFANCRGLTAITVDTTNSAFSSMDGVLFNKSQTILIACPGGKAGSYAVPNSVTSIGANAFLGCTILGGISIPNNVVSIRFGAFVWCFGLTNVTIPDSVTTIEDNAFANCNSLTNVTILNSVIGTYEFVGCPVLSSATIGNRVTSIGYQALAYCPSLTRLTIPNSVTNIGGAAFQNCYGLTNVTIGKGVTSVGTYAFAGCTNLASMFFQGDAPYLDSDPFYHTTSIIYYLPRTTGWTFPFGGRIALLWDPLMGAPALRTNQFGFAVAGTAEIPMVIETCTNSANSTWLPLRTCTLTNGSIYFSDPEWTSYPTRLYRIRSP